jgi:apolipoprotein N-acyltransferase
MLIVISIDVPRIRKQAIPCGIVVMGFVLAGSIMGPSISNNSPRVACIGFNSRDSRWSNELGDEQRFQRRFVEPLIGAEQGGARLAVFPEMTFEFGQSERKEWISRFSQTVRQHRIAVIIGIYDCSFNENRIVFINSEGDLVGQYTKIHLTPFEPFIKGFGPLIQIDIDGIGVGGMICHDDNYTDLSRQYGRKGVQLVAVPTMDWQTVRYPHLQSSIHRAIESGYAVVRATMDGITAIIGPDGRVIASVDHLRNPETILIADVPCGQGETLYSRFGNWIIPFSGIIIALHLVRMFVRRIKT